jgi:hypothetical protein
MFLENRLADGDEVVSIMRRQPFTSRKIPGTNPSGRGLIEILSQRFPGRTDEKPRKPSTSLIRVAAPSHDIIQS